MQQRMTFADSWNTLEQACLASAVRLFGDHETNWSTVCNHLKTKFSLIERPGNWLTPESCEAQYKWLSDKYVKMEISCERPVNQILQNLKQIGEHESQPLLEQERKYKELKERLELFANNEIDSEIVMEFYEEACKRNREREENLRKQGLVSDSPVTKSLKDNNKTDGGTPLTTSPLLSSLLNNPPAVQYRPTLSTASFIPTKTAQGVSRTSFERVHTSEAGQRVAYNPNLGSQSSPSSERSSLFTSSTSSPARKLDFQDPSTSSSVVSHEQLLPIAKEGSREASSSNEPVIKSNIHNLENINLIPAAEEYLSEADMLLQVIDNLEGKELLDKVLDELTGEKESIIEKDLNAVTIPLGDSFVANDSGPKNTATVSTLSPEPKTAAVLNSPLISTKFDQYAATEDVITIEEEPTNEQLTDDANITNVQQSGLAETMALNADSSSFSSLAISVGSESISETKSDSEPLVEYLDSSEVEKSDENCQPVESTEVKEVDTKLNNGNASDETKESDDVCNSALNVTETVDEPTFCVKISAPEAEEVTLKSVEEVKETKEEPNTKEVTAVRDTSLIINLTDTFDLDDILAKRYEQKTEEKKADEIVSDTNAKDEIKPAQVDTVEQSLPETVPTPPTISKPIHEEASSPVLPVIIEERIPIPIEKEPHIVKVSNESEMKVSNESEIIQSHESEKVSLVVKNKRQLPRRRRSTTSESNDPPEIAKLASEETESAEKENDAKKVPAAKEMNITIRDFQTESPDSNIIEALLTPKEEPVDEPCAPPAQTSPSKTKTEREKPTIKNADVKKSKQKVLSRRNSSRSQNQTPSTPKIEEIMASPSTPSSSKTNDMASTKKKSLLLVYHGLAGQKYSGVFQKPIANKTVKGYEEVIYCPSDLQTIKKKIDKCVISTVTEFQRDVLLMILNAKMFNRINSQVYNMAVEMQKEALKNIQLTVQTLGEGVLFEMEDDITEKVRKRQSVENVKKDSKPTKRSKPSLKDEATPIKKIKLEENEPVT